MRILGIYYADSFLPGINGFMNKSVRFLFKFFCKKRRADTEKNSTDGFSPRINDRIKSKSAARAMICVNARKRKNINTFEYISRVSI